MTHTTFESQSAELKIYITRHCQNCDYALQVAEGLRRDYPQLDIELVDMELTADEKIPAVIFATPTYLLNGQVWSLGNPSNERILTTFGPPTVLGNSDKA